MELAETIRQRIKTELGFTVNIGISNNKLLAKVAYHMKINMVSYFVCENITF